MDVPFLLDEPEVNLAPRMMMTGLAERFAEMANHHAHESERLRKQWRYFAAWRANGQARAYLDAAESILTIARNL